MKKFIVILKLVVFTTNVFWLEQGVASQAYSISSLAGLINDQDAATKAYVNPLENRLIDTGVYV